MRIVVIEDDDRMRRWLARMLGEAGYLAEAAATASEGLFLASSAAADLVLLDLGLPDRPGSWVIGQLRGRRSTVPIIVVSGESDDLGIASALDAGADDYVVKPVSSTTLLARVRAAMRRGGAQRTEQLTCGSLVVNRLNHTVLCNGRTMQCTPRDFALLEHFARHCGEIVTRTALREHAWESEADFDSNILDAAIARLRRRLREHGASVTIRTARTVGYRMEEESAPPD